jgi:hypothetical protein
MRIRIDKRREGSIPSETVVAISTVSGVEEVVVHSSQADANSVEVGFISEKEGRYLIELPRETFSGRWRIWVPKSAAVA